MSDLIKYAEVPEMLSMAKHLQQSGLLPSCYRKPEQVFLVIQQGRELGIPPMAAINGISVIQGKPTIGANLMAALIFKSGAGHFNIVDRSPDISVIEFVRNGVKTVFTFTIEDAKRAKLTGKDNWQKYPANMLYCRNLSNGARAVFPDAIMGLYLHEEINPDLNVTEEGEILEQVIDVKTKPMETPVSKPETITQDEYKHLADLIGDKLELRDRILKAYGLKNLAEIAACNYDNIVKRIETLCGKDDKS